MSNLGPNFYSKFNAMCKRLSIDPAHLLNVMTLESGLNPAAHNKNGNAVGLIQFMPNTLKSLGYHGTYEDFKKLQGEDQLE
jgi:soluble lytic murein transglycosylase-like protein